jgi:CheY-like chemotaxis protein
MINMAGQQIRILLVEDNPGDARLVREAVREAGNVLYQLSNVDRLEEALSRLRTERFDVVLLDLGLPDSQGLDTLLRARKEQPGVTIVVLTGLDDETIAIQALRSGAQDYLVKGQIDGRLLVRATRYAIERTRRERADALRKSQSQQMWKSLYKILGPGSSAVLYRAGSEAGLNTFDFIQEHWNPKDEQQFLEALQEHLSYAGLCTTREFRIDREPFRAIVQVERSFEHGLHEGPAERPVCHFLRGLVCGIAIRLSGEPDLMCDETACEARGDAACVFSIHRMFA